MSLFCKQTKEGILLYVLVKPNANNDRIVELGENYVVIEISEPPIKGRANKQLIKFLRKILQTRDIELIKGERTRNKILLVKGISLNDIISRLKESCNFSIFE